VPDIDATSPSHSTPRSARAKSPKLTNGKGDRGRKSDLPRGQRKVRKRGRADAVLRVLEALIEGDFEVRLQPQPQPRRGVDDDDDVASAINALATRLERLERTFQRLSRAVRHDGDTSARAETEGESGGWARLAPSLNGLVRDLSAPSWEIRRVLSAVAAGDLTQRIPLEVEGDPVRGDFRGIASTVNTLVEQLGRLASEVTRVAHEVGAEGKLGARVRAPGLAGTWLDLTDQVNTMAGNLTTQVRGIASVVNAVANGDLSRKVVVDAEGEVLELSRTVNRMVDQLGAFAVEVTRVAREVGIEGKLGGQARVPNVAGTWLDLTENVNQLADNLTRQVRAMSEVALTAVGSAEEALEAIEREHFDCAVFDLRLPGKSGFEAMKGDREKCIDAGASDYVTKPVDPDRLLSLVKVWVYTREPGRT